MSFVGHLIYSYLILFQKGFKGGLHKVTLDKNKYMWKIKLERTEEARN